MAEKLAERTERFAREVRALVRSLPRTIGNMEDAKQAVRSSGSVAAKQIEADNPLGDADRLMKFRICRKEARETGLWLRLFHLETGSEAALMRDRLDDETRPLAAIYLAIITKLE